MTNKTYSRLNLISLSIEYFKCSLALRVMSCPSSGPTRVLSAPRGTPPTPPSTAPTTRTASSTAAGASRTSRSSGTRRGGSDWTARRTSHSPKDRGQVCKEEIVRKIQQKEDDIANLKMELNKIMGNGREEEDLGQMLENLRFGTQEINII